MPIFAAAPMAIQESLLFPYLNGAEFMRRFEQRRPGVSPLDSMPVSTEQVLSEEAYFGTPRDAPVVVTLPPGRDAEHEESLGEFGTRLLVYQHLGNSTEAITAAQGWDGDRYRVIRSGTGRGIVWVTVWDSAMDAAQFVDALGQGIGRRYRAGAPAISPTGVRTYQGSGRTVVFTPLEIGGRVAVMYVDVPAGAPTTVLDPRRIAIGE